MGIFVKAAGAVLFAVALIFNFAFPVNLILFAVAYILIGGEIVVKAVKNIFRGEVFDENFLMTIASVGAFCLGEYAEAVAVMLFYQVGEELQESAVRRSEKSITALMEIKPEYANVLENGVIKTVPPEAVRVGDIMAVKPGEKIPLDGVVTEGETALDTISLTGESLPREVGAGAEVYAGSVNLTGLIYVEVMREFAESAVSKILELVENAADKKAPAESFITKFAGVYTPIVVALAALIAFIPTLVLGFSYFPEFLHRALVFLVVSCPCALVVSIPLSYFAGIGLSARNGILVKGGNYLEALGGADTVVFDKTGTLTKGRFKVTEIESFGDAAESAVLAVAAHVESFSNHPIALSIVAAYDGMVDMSRVTDAKEIPGRGVAAMVDGTEVLAGGAKLMEQYGIKTPDGEAGVSVIFIAIGGALAGKITVADELKSDARRAIDDLRSIGIDEIAILTGDSEKTGAAVGASLGVPKVYAELLPHEKVEVFERITGGNSGKTTVFVGDGINDAPVLALADIGVSMGALGSDAAIEASDVVIMTDEPSKLPQAIKIARRTKRIVVQNIVFALGAKAVLLVLGALGYASMWAAVFGDVGVALLTVLNAVRLLRKAKAE